MTDVTAITGFILFAFSEIIGILPIPSNGILHTVMIGLKDIVKKPNVDLEMARSMIDHNPDISNLITQIASNNNLSETIKQIVNNPMLITHVNNITTSEELQYILHTLYNNPKLVTQIKSDIENKLMGS
jgi:hypothetical protein